MDGPMIINGGGIEVEAEGIVMRVDRQLDAGLATVLARALTQAGLTPKEVASAELRLGEDISRWVIIFETAPVHRLPIVVEIAETACNRATGRARALSGEIRPAPAPSGEPRTSKAPIRARPGLS
jgi:hypothetical protein